MMVPVICAEEHGVCKISFFVLGNSVIIRNHSPDFVYNFCRRPNGLEPGGGGEDWRTEESGWETGVGTVVVCLVP